MNRKTGLAAVSLIGLIAGVMAAQSLPDRATKCAETEAAIENNSSIRGAVACFPPGVIGVNRTEKVEEKSELECVCRRSWKGNIQIWAVSRTNS
ncbi:MAG: hypothetical protein ABEJ95_02005 [Candidatus Nanohalobium sp.]